MKTGRYRQGLWALLAAVLVGLTGCGAAAGGYQSISQEAAKELMDSGSAYVLLDVRTPEEYAAGHIAGAVLLPDYEVADKAETVLPDKDKPILVYCRSGNRSKRASAALAQLGYTAVREIGGINTWPYGTVTE